MKILLTIIFCLFSLTAFAYDHAYSVTGVNDDGEIVSGIIYSDNANPNISGQLTDKDGYTHTVEGQWNGKGQISGMTDEGDAVQLTTVN